MSVIERKVDLTEDQVLILLSLKITFRGLIMLKMALDHVPSFFGTISRGSKLPLRFSLVHTILEKNGLRLSPNEVEKYACILKQCCPAFLAMKFNFGESLWHLTKEGSVRYNRFIGPPIESCLECEEALVMKNPVPSNAVVYGIKGPLPASKATLVCNRCKITYGVGSYSTGNGRKLYPKKMESSLVEASNLTYMDRDLYKWIPSLG